MFVYLYTTNAVMPHPQPRTGRLGEVLTPDALRAHSMHASTASLAHYPTRTKPDHAAMVQAIPKKKT
jgi:hypothetical protein